MSEHGEHLAALIMTVLAVVFAFAAVYGWSGVPQHPTASRVLKWIVFCGAAVWGIYSAIVFWRNKGTASWTNLNWQDVVVIQAYALASWRWLAIIALALFAFLIGRSTRNSADTETEAQVLQKPDLEKSLSDNLRGCQDEWLHEKLKIDKATIRDLVWVASIFYRRDFDKSQPRIDFVFNIFNNSLLDLVISMDGGYILFSDENEQFYFDPKFIAQNPALCRSRDATNFVIRQAITGDEITKHFKDTDNTRISFGNLRVSFRGTERFPEITPTLLDVNHYLFTGQGAWHNPNRPKFLSEQESALPVEKANLVFKGIGRLHAYSLYGYPLEEGHASESDSNSAYQVIALTVQVENEFTNAFKPIPIRDVTAQIFYYPKNSDSFQLNRGSWLGSGNRTSFEVNDLHHLVIATVMGEGDDRFVYALNREYRDDQGFDKVGVVLSEDVYDVRVRVISETEGLLHFEKKLVLEVGEVPTFRISLRPAEEADSNENDASNGVTDSEVKINAASINHSEP